MGSDLAPSMPAIHVHQPSTTWFQLFSTLRWLLAEPGINSENYIVCAPTGTEKTIDAGLIISHHLQKRQNLEKFVVPTWPLTEQQVSTWRKKLECDRSPRCSGGGEHPNQPVWCHPLNLIKLEICLLHPVGLSVNDGTDEKLSSLSYTSVDSIVNTILFLGQRTMLAKIDVWSAYWVSSSGLQGSRLAVARLDQLVLFYFKQALAQSTTRSYKSAKKKYLAFCCTVHCSPVPVSEAGLFAFCGISGSRWSFCYNNQVLFIRGAVLATPRLVIWPPTACPEWN